MKLKEVLYGLHVLKPAIQEYPYELQSFHFVREGDVDFAHWLHPKELRKRFDQDYVDVLRTFLKPGDYAIDIGAHTGDTTLPMALAVGPKGGVFALEPNPHVYKVLEANAGLNRDKTNIHPLMFAATEEDAELEFEYSDPGLSNGGLHKGISHWKHGHFFKVKVQGRNLLNYLKREFPDAIGKIRYLKIDTEGHDRFIVNALREIVVANRPYIRTEVYKHLPLEERIGFYRDLKGYGYRIYKFGDEKQYQQQELREENLMDWPAFDFFAVPG